MWTLTARWIVPVEGPPCPGGTVTFDGQRIVAVEPHGQRRPDVDLGDVAVLPGLVNAHTHLDLSGARGRTPPAADFTLWLRAVIRHRRGLSAAEVEADVRAGLAESLAHGTTLLGDIAGQGLSWPVLGAAPVRAVVFHELLGLSQGRAAEAVRAAQDWLQTHPAQATCRPGVSPHAPYSVRAQLFEAAADLAHAFRIPLTTHLAETAAELELLRDHTGPFVPFLKELGVWDESGLVDTPRRVLQLCAPAPRRLLAHGNYLSADVPSSPGDTVVYCPRTHAAFGHPPHPFRELLARGVRVALGTDSLASNPDLSVLNEARFLHKTYPEVEGAALLRMATLAGAEALGWADETGSLTPGKSADLVVVPVSRDEGVDPHDSVLGSTAPVRAVLWRGRWVHGAAAEIHPVP
jgi:cytosine/adenosine deaminase-related metal-dependent hydrolase